MCGLVQNPSECGLKSASLALGFATWFVGSRCEDCHSKSGGSAAAQANTTKEVLRSLALILVLCSFQNPALGRPRLDLRADNSYWEQLAFRQLGDIARTNAPSRGERHQL